MLYLSCEMIVVSASSTKANLIESKVGFFSFVATTNVWVSDNLRIIV